MNKRKWRWLMPLVAVTALFGAVAANATPVGTVDYENVSGVTVQAIGADLASVPAGNTLKAGVKLVSDHSLTVDTAVISARDPNGVNVDFPATSPYTVGVNQQTLEASRSFTVEGVYTYQFSYLLGSTWYTPGPTRTFTVTAAVPQAPATPTVISLAEAPNPTDTATPSQVTAHVWAQPQTVNTLVFACRTPTNGNCDFGHQFNFAFNGSDQTFSTSHTFTSTGNYSVWVAYEAPAGSWHNLTPTHTVTVNTAGGGGGGTTTGLPDRPGGATSAKTLLFGDGFDGTSVDEAKWSYRSNAEPYWCLVPFGTANDNKQLEFDQPANAAVSGGALALTAKYQPTTACGKTRNWTSALLTSRKDTGVTPNQGSGFAFDFGWIEARMKFPADRGFWPAWWTWQTGGTWVETDAVEYYSNNKTQIYQTSHAGSAGGCISTPSFDPSAGYHTYGARITSTGTTFYVDGAQTCSVGGHPLAGQTTTVILDNFVFQDVPPLNNSVVGVTLVDYAGVWSN